MKPAPTTPRREALLMRLFNAVGYLQAARQIVKRGERRVEEAYRALVAHGWKGRKK